MQVSTDALSRTSPKSQDPCENSCKRTLPLSLMGNARLLSRSLRSCSPLPPPDWSLPLMCDASDYAVGAQDKKPHAIYYASRTFNDAQLNYSTTEKELLALVFALECDPDLQKLLFAYLRTINLIS